MSKVTELEVIFPVMWVKSGEQSEEEFLVLFDKFQEDLLALGYLVPAASVKEKEID